MKILTKYYNTHADTVHNFIWRSLQIFGKQGITLLIFILCAKLLTPYDFGIYNYILAIIFFLITFGDFGISTATSKYTAEYNTTDKDKLKRLLFNSLIIIICLASLVTLLTVIFGGFFLGENYIYVLYALPLIFLTPITSLYDGIFRGLKRFKELAAISLSVGLSSIIFIFLIISNFGLKGALVSQSLFYLILIIVLSLKYGNLHFKLDNKLIKTVSSYSFVIGISTIAYFLYSRVDILILGHFNYIKEIGYYELINRGFELMFLPFALLAQVIAPNITSHYSKGNYLVVRNKLYFFAKRIIPLAILIAIIFYFIFPWVIKIFLPEYHVKEMLIAISILSFLIPAKIWGVFQVQSFIVATGYAKIIAITTLISGLLNVVLDVVFINLFGFVGVFWVTLIVHSLTITLNNFVFFNALEEKTSLRKYAH